MNKKEWYDHFGQKISKTCIVDDQTGTGSYMIQGKYCLIQTDFSYGEDAGIYGLAIPWIKARG